MEKEAEWLLSEKYNGEKTEGFFTDLKRLESGEPLAYVIGHVPFLDTKIYLDSKPLIPRPETEYWVKQVIDELQNVGKQIRALDLCAGSGCIGVAILKHTTCSVDFVEIDEAHHATIQKNINGNDIDPKRANIIGGDLFEQLGQQQYDLILSNPPYIDPNIDRASESVKKYEPHIALYGGDKGIAIIADIILDGSLHLKDGGVMYIEHEPEQEEQLHQLATESGLHAASERDQFGIIRYTRLSK